MIQAPPLTTSSILRLLFSFTFWLISSLSHLQFSLFLVNPIQTSWGTITLKHYAPQAGYLLIVLFFLYLFWYGFRGAYLYCGLLLWLGWALIIAVINLYLLATPIENIHFVQYGLLSSLLLWSLNTTQNPTVWLIPKVLFWTTLAGITDEILQYIWITASYSDYMDFNDFLLNMMGSIGGILFYSGFNALKTEKLSLFKTLRSLEAGVIYLISILLAIYYTLNKQLILLLERKPDTFGSWQPNFSQGYFYVLTPLEGIVLLIFLSLGFILLKSQCNQRGGSWEV
ncbi:MAG: VanZ family protein [gamma proteobacterium symbiont of Taylorina sp.]|nr:VanZ family protein [gamma proteobacterium symbiont of Taylorina sp.]